MLRGRAKLSEHKRLLFSLDCGMGTALFFYTVFPVDIRIGQGNCKVAVPARCRIMLEKHAVCLCFLLSCNDNRQQI